MSTWTTDRALFAVAVILALGTVALFAAIVWVFLRFLAGSVGGLV